MFNSDYLVLDVTGVRRGIFTWFVLAVVVSSLLYLVDAVLKEIKGHHKLVALKARNNWREGRERIRFKAKQLVNKEAAAKLSNETKSPASVNLPAGEEKEAKVPAPSPSVEKTTPTTQMIRAITEDDAFEILDSSPSVIAVPNSVNGVGSTAESPAVSPCKQGSESLDTVEESKKSSRKKSKKSTKKGARRTNVKELDGSKKKSKKSGKRITNVKKERRSSVFKEADAAKKKGRRKSVAENHDHEKKEKGKERRKSVAENDDGEKRGRHKSVAENDDHEKKKKRKSTAEVDVSGHKKSHNGHHHGDDDHNHGHQHDHGHDGHKHQHEHGKHKHENDNGKHGHKHGHGHGGHKHH